MWERSRDGGGGRPFTDASSWRPVAPAFTPGCGAPSRWIGPWETSGRPAECSRRAACRPGGRGPERVDRAMGALGASRRMLPPVVVRVRDQPERTIAELEAGLY